MEAYGSLLKTILVLALLVSTAIGISSAQTVISIESAEDISIGSTTWINVTAVNISDPDGIGSYRFNLTFDPTVANVLDIQSPLGAVTKNINNEAGWAKFNQFFTEGVKTNGTILARIQLKAMRGDGATSSLNLTIEKLYDPQGSPIPAIAINGTFTTLDEVSPSITFDKSNGSTVGPNLDVAATLYDLSGINESSIEVYINGTKLADGYTVAKINNTTWNVVISKNVSEFLNVDLPHDIEITVKASDTKGNSATAVLIVTAANIGFFNPYPSDNNYINKTNITISVRYSQIDPDTIKMFFDGNNVTSNIVVDKPNNTVSYTATNLAEGKHTVKVNGTGVDGKEWSLTWNFTVDVTPPTIAFFTVKEGDGDGFIERFEDLTAYWNISDLNFDRIEIIYDGNAVKTNNSANASLIFTLSEYGGYVTLKAYDKAGNCVESSEKFYVSNNYVAYVIRSQPKTVLGGQLNITKIATLDFMDPNVAEYELIGASGFSLPLQNAERIITPGSKANYTVVIDENANKTLSQFPDTAVIYDENTMLDFYIKAPARGLIIVIKLNNSEAKDMGQDLLEKRSLKGFSLENLTDLMEYAYIFDERGWVQAKYDKSTNKFTKIGTTRGTFTLQEKLNDIIEKHSVDLTNGFKLSDHDANYTTSGSTVRPVLEKGYYALVVVDVDTLKDMTALDLAVPFVVLNGTLNDNKPTVANSAIVGNKVKMEFPATFNAASAVILKKVDYSAKVEVNLTKGILEIGNVTLEYNNKPLREIKLFGKSTNTYVPEGMFKGAYATKDSNVLKIDTSGLEPGEYYIYVVAIDKDYMTLYAGELTIKLTQDIIQPTIDISIKSANATTIVLHYKFVDNNLLDRVYMKATYPDNTVLELLNKSNIRKESLEDDLTINVSIISEGQVIEIFAEATDVSGNKATAKLTATKPVTAKANETKELRPSKDVTVELIAGANNTTVVVLAATAKKPEEFNVTGPPLTPVKFVKVDAEVVNGSVPRWTLKVTYTDQEIAGLDESSLVLYYWDELNQTWKSLKDYVNKWVDPTHFVYSYEHNMANNYIKVVLSNLSTFALGAKAKPPTTVAPAPPAPPIRGGGGGGYVITPTGTPPLVTTATPTTTVTIPTTPTITTTVTTTVKPTPTTPKKPAWGIPGFEAIFAIAGLLAIAYLLRRRKH